MADAFTAAQTTTPDQRPADDGRASRLAAAIEAAYLIELSRR